MLPPTITIHPPEPNALIALGIGGIAVIVATGWILLFSLGDVRRAISLTLLAMLVMAGSTTAAWSGVLAQFNQFPPPMLLMIASVLAMAFAFGFSHLGRDAADHLSFAGLIGLQSFRLPLELVMHQAGAAGIMPVALSYSGYNFDIATGAGALVLFILLKLGRPVSFAVLWLWNIWGSYCLVAIVVIAITTSPMVRLFGDDPAHLNTWVLYFPYVWLPVVLVTIAIASHVIIWRKLLAQATEAE